MEPFHGFDPKQRSEAIQCINSLTKLHTIAQIPWLGKAGNMKDFPKSMMGQLIFASGNDNALEKLKLYVGLSMATSYFLPAR